MSKLALGTVQFGLDYGINNQRGKVPENEAVEILEYAFKSGIDTLDTAAAYGSSEEVIGKFIRKNPKAFKIVSKLPKCRSEEVIGIVERSLERLKGPSLYGYLLHDFKSFQGDPEILNGLNALKACGRIRKVGFSLYYPAELEFLLQNKVEFDLLQVPYSIFDQRFGKYFKKMKDQGVEVHTRSTFLQGLVFKPPRELAPFFDAIKDKLSKLADISEPVSACLGFVLLNKQIDRVVVGVDSRKNLEEIIRSADMAGRVADIYDDLAALKEDSENILLPFNWKGVN